MKKENLKTVLSIAEDYGLEINWSKCQFLKTKISYLGYEIENGCIRPNVDKVRAVLKYPRPQDLKQVQKFLGLAGYFRKFIAKPLSEILKKKFPLNLKLKKRWLCQLYRKGKQTDQY